MLFPATVRIASDLHLAGYHISKQKKRSKLYGGREKEITVWKKTSSEDRSNSSSFGAGLWQLMILVQEELCLGKLSVNS